jgi:hypothetical protein
MSWFKWSSWAGVGAVTLIALGARYLAKKAKPLAPRGRVWVENSVLHGPGDKTYRLTDSDMLWLGRAMVGEVGERASLWDNAETRRGGAAVIWALAQNFMLIIGSGGKRPRFDTFTQVVRAYCQPVNPAWARGGRFVVAPHPRLSEASWRRAITEDKLNRRERISSMSWNSLPVKVRELIDSFRAGTLENPIPGMVDWAAGNWTGGQVRIAGNLFGSRPGKRLA